MFVVARRWDQLGGRLSAIVNALSVAELSGLEFAFVWPPGDEPALRDPSEIFDEAFIARHRLSAAQLEHLIPVDYSQLVVHAGTPSKLARNHFAEVNEIFEVIVGPGEGHAAARKRFVECFDRIGWSEEVQRLIDFCRSWPGEEQTIAALHVRAGDIITGAWRHVLVHEKYTPTPFIREAMHVLADDGSKPIVVVSDNAEYIAWLQGRFRSALSPAEIVPGYKELTEAQRALADILLLARCEPIVGPPSSAFSRLAANLGPGRLDPADRLLAPPGRERTVLLAGIEEAWPQARYSPLWSGLVARDICWCLDVFGDTLSFDRQRDLARGAVELATNFVGALTRYARCMSLAGRDADALGAAARALSIAQTVQRQPDPMFEALATEITARTFASVRGPMRSLASLWSYGRWLRRDMAPEHEAAREAFNRIHDIQPYWIDREAAWDTLRYMLSVVDALRADPTARRRVAGRLRSARVDALDLLHHRPHGLDEHRAVTTFDPLTRDLERIALHLHRAAGLPIDPPRLAA